MNEDLMRQFLGAALMCGETIKNKVDRENPDTVEIFLRDSGLDLFIDAVELGFIEQISHDESDWVVTEKGLELLK